MEDIPELEDANRAESAVRRFRETRKKYRGLLVALVMMEFRAAVLQIIYTIAGALLTTAGPLILYRLLDVLSRPDTTSAECFTLVLLLALTNIGRTQFKGHAWHLARQTAIRVGSVLVDEIYRKSLTRASRPTAHSESSPTGFSSASVGTIMSLMSQDADRIKEYLPFAAVMVLVVLEIVVAASALVLVMGWPGAVGVGLVGLYFGVTWRVGKWVDPIFRRLYAASDRRHGLLNEALVGIRAIKYFAWEPTFLAKIHRARAAELHELISYYLQSIITNFIQLLVPNLIVYSVLVALTQWTSQPVDAKLAFTAMALFDAIKDPVNSLTDQLQDVLGLGVAVGRIER
ncbi:hypothetical protein HDU96_004962, partial [Phlyctochytrium bullatum]